MNSSVNIQPPFMYHIWPILVALLVLLALGVFILLRYFRNKQEKTQPVVQKPIERKFISDQDKQEIRTRYLALLEELNRKLKAGEILPRPAYQQLSAYVRDFVKEISGVDVTKSTLKQIRNMNVPVITPLITNYYEPEFALETDDDVHEAILNAGRIIERWN